MAHYYNIISPVNSAEFIAQNSENVKIHEEGIEKLSEEILTNIKDGQLQIPECGGEEIHPSKDHPKAVDWIFVIDTLNFCFWSNTNDPKWTVEGYTGYYALEAALHRAIREGFDITNSNYYSKITETDLKHILRGDNEVTVPLLNERLEALHEVGEVLMQKFNGSFEECVKIANRSALKLLEIVIENFKCFRDEASYKGKVVSFYKRAQILIADLWNFCGRTGWGDFNDIDKLTMFADYRVPQVLVYFGAMSYSNRLNDLLMKDVLLPSGSPDEVEIRGCSIHVIELLKKKLEEKLKASKATENVDVPNSSLLDYYLWCYRRKYAKEVEHIPFHKVLGIYY